MKTVSSIIISKALLDNTRAHLEKSFPGSRFAVNAGKTKNGFHFVDIYYDAYMTPEDTKALKGEVQRLSQQKKFTYNIHRMAF